jgi:Domain of unknown function (DUF4907)
MQHRLQEIKNSLPLLLVTILFSCTSQQNGNAVLTDQEPAYKVFVVQKDDNAANWGYEIEHNHKLMIKQFSIPALEGEQPFASKEQAAQTGGLVAKKLNLSMRPTISKAELDSLGIIQSTHAKQKK